MLQNNNTIDSSSHYVVHRPHKHEVYFQNIMQLYGKYINVILCIPIRKVCSSLLSFLWNSQVFNSNVCRSLYSISAKSVNEKSTGINPFMSNLCFHCADFHKTHSCLLSFCVHLLYQILFTSDGASRNLGELHSWS